MKYLCIGMVLIVLASWVSAALHGLWRRASGRPWLAIRARLGWGRGLAELARRLDVPLDELASFEPRYRAVAIPKKGGGHRELLVPDKYTKRLQRRILRRLLDRLYAHPAAHGFEKGRSIVTNALPHVGQAVVVHMDVVDFFPNTRAERIERYFRRIGWNAAAAALLTRLTCHDGGLPQGAPTSPRLSNLVNVHLDVVLSNMATERGGAYTRYADDLTFSLPRDAKPATARWLVVYARMVLAKKGYTLHEREKLSIRRSHQQQRVTGLVVNAKVQLPRTTRRKLRAIRHRLATHGAATLTAEQLAGWTALEAMIATQRDAGSGTSQSAAGARAS